jgi:ParB-like chromosome segregation protein Spo0J
MDAPVEYVPLDQIVVGDRRREDLGDLTGLRASIREHGLIHPIVLTEDNVLVAGERRLRAHALEGFEAIPARRWGALSPEEQRALELEENLHRKDLTPYEQSKTLVALTAAVREQAQGELRTNLARNSRGHPVEPGSYREVADQIGVPVSTIRHAEQHVAAVAEFPELAGVSQHEALEVAQELRQAPEEKRMAVRAAYRTAAGHRKRKPRRTKLVGESIKLMLRLREIPDLLPAAEAKLTTELAVWDPEEARTFVAEITTVAAQLAALADRLAAALEPRGEDDGR